MYWYLCAFGTLVLSSIFLLTLKDATRDSDSEEDDASRLIDKKAEEFDFYTLNRSRSFVDGKV